MTRASKKHLRTCAGWATLDTQIMRVFIDEPGAFLHEVDLPTIPNVGDFVTYQSSPPEVETRRVIWRRVEGDTLTGLARVVIGVEDRRPVDVRVVGGVE